MRHLVLFFTLSLGLCASAIASQPVKAKLNKVTVYLQGAHLYYSENLNLNTGNTELVFENISPYINETSLQASCKGAVVMDVRHIIKYKEVKPVTNQYAKEIQNVLDSIDEVQFELKGIEYKLSVLVIEKNAVLNNRIMKGQPLRDSLPLLKEGMIYLKEKLNSIYEEELKLERASQKFTRLKDKLNNRYSNLMLLQSGQSLVGTGDAQPIHQVVVNLFSEADAPATVNFNYFIASANWVPQYDIQASSVNNSFQIKYFGAVSQYSGLDWKDIPLTLSTSNPTESNAKPTLNPWYMGYVAAMDKLRNRETVEIAIISKKPASMNESVDESAEKNLDDAKYFKNYVEVTENLIRTEYEIKLKYDIATDNKPYKVLINQKELGMKMEFAAVPKICTDAFLQAKVTGWEEMNIIPGNSRLYYDNAYVGEVFLNNSSDNDTLTMNLGRDKTMNISRKKLKDKFKTKFIGDERVEIRSVEISVRNTKSIPVEINIEDQIPVVAGTNEIKVQLLESDGATLDDVSGKLTWKLALKARETRKITFSYEVRYPKDKPIAGL